MELLSRDDFRNAVFERDHNRCVICKASAKDAHHIVERRLFDDGGYYLDNGVSLCERHHIEAEKTLLTCEQLREVAGIEQVILPEHLYGDVRYDKWGNIILANGTRLKGELFFDESVQKILSDVITEFTKYVRYPRTYHLPWSPGVTSDDKVIPSTDIFDGQEVVVTLKMDGENTTMYSDYIHARSLDSRNHLSRNWVKNFHAQIAYNIPDGWRICGENMFAKHSIKYRNLASYFYMFSIWDEKNMCLDWDTTTEWAELLGVERVPVLYRGVYDEEILKTLYKSDYNGNECEGYLVRKSSSFFLHDFRKPIAKYVRSGHVQTHAFWMNQQIEKNELASDK